MKHGILATFIGLLAMAAVACAVTVEGNILLSGQSEHSGSWAVFRAVSPSAQSDSAQTGSSGYFAVELSPGVYDVEYRHAAYATYRLDDQLLLFDTVLDSVVLMLPLFGALSGYLGPGDFQVTDSIRVDSGHTLTIWPGTRLYFEPSLGLTVRGTLEATGTEQDSIVFTRRYETQVGRWKGIRLDHAQDSCPFSYCRIEGAGGTSPGIRAYYSSVEIRHCTIRRNRNLNAGGGISLSQSNGQIEDCDISENRATEGGGLYAGHPPLLTILRTTFSRDTANDWGGAMELDGGAPLIRGCVLTLNSGYWGAGIACGDSAEPLIEGCEISYNGSSGSGNNGGGLYIYESGGTLRNCLVAGNAVYGYGGGLWAMYSHMHVEQCTFVGNRAGHVGGIYCGYSPLLITSSIIAYSKRGDGGGGGVGIAWAESPDAQFTYSTVFGSQGSNLSGGPVAIGVIALTNANGDSCDTYYNIFLDPQFVDTTAGDYHLTAGSPCIDAGDPTLPHDPDGTVADMGAYYFDQMGTEDRGRNELRPYRLLQNYPNPFNAVTRITFDLPRASEVELRVYDITGRLVAILVRGPVAAGSHTVVFDGEKLPSGMYVYRLKEGEAEESRRMVLVK